VRIVEDLKWVSGHENLSNALKILNPFTKETLAQLSMSEHEYAKGGAAYIYLQESIDALREDLQATRSPNPKKFSTEKFIFETIEQFNQISSQIEESKQLIRKFASTRLTVEDFF
jgi:hypothetical protein